MSRWFRLGAQNPKTPHPGKIELKYAWNNSTEIHDASEYPEEFILRCYDENGNVAPRARATCCIPVVELVIRSYDKDGEPVDPKDADHQSIMVRGPERIPIEHLKGRGKIHP